jgi:hypothetical protein
MQASMPAKTRARMLAPMRVAILEVTLGEIRVAIRVVI